MFNMTIKLLATVRDTESDNSWVESEVNLKGSSEKELSGKRMILGEPLLLIVQSRISYGLGVVKV